MFDPKRVPFRLKLSIGVTGMVALTSIILASGILFMIDGALNATGMDPTVLNSLEQKLMLVAGGIVVIGILGSMMGSVILVRTLIEPLRLLSTFTREVAQGNYKTSIEYLPKDVLSETIEAIKEMTGELKTKLGLA